MAFDPTINLGTIISGAVTIGGILIAYHKWDQKVEIRHEQNKNQIANIDQKVDRVERKIDDNTSTTRAINDKVIDLNLKMEKHITADDIIQRQIINRLDNGKP